MNRSRFPIVIVLILSLLAAGLTRNWSEYERARGNPFAHTGGTAAGLGKMNSYALALLLGGLRGPLVMFLWPSAEAQKRDKDLDDFDTKIEWIRLLQAEFDTVHIFQIWNKAYNISAQLSNLGNKYRTIIDALDYARSVDAEKPNDINILSAMGQIYFYKLGDSTEKFYYRQRVRDETQARQEMVRVTLPAGRREEFSRLAQLEGLPARKLIFSADEKSDALSIRVPKSIADAVQTNFSGAGIDFASKAATQVIRNEPGTRQELDPVLDRDGLILRALIAPRVARPADLDPKSEWNDGSDLQYLPPLEPYPYGVSTFAMAYNFDKRSQVLQTVSKQKHAQFTESVVDSRPALDLKNWSEEEWERGRRAELEAFAKPTPTLKIQLENDTASLPLDSSPTYRPRLDEALYSYKQSINLIDRSVAEYKRHLATYTVNITTYVSHMDDMAAQQDLLRGDYDYLLAMINPAQRAELSKSAAQHYRDAIQKYNVIILQYLVSDDMIQRFYPKDVGKAIIGKSNLSADELDKLSMTIRANLPKVQYFENAEEFSDNYSRIDRAKARLKLLGQ